MRCFFEHKVIYLCAEFQVCQTPSTGFLAIDTTFLTNIPGNNFAHNIVAVFYHSELKFSNLDQNWAKNRPLLLKTLDVSNCVDCCIVQCLVRESVSDKVTYWAVRGQLKTDVFLHVPETLLKCRKSTRRKIYWTHFYNLNIIYSEQAKSGFKSTIENQNAGQLQGLKIYFLWSLGSWARSGFQSADHSLCFQVPSLFLVGW